MGKKRACSGLSLLELLIVVSVMSVMATLSIPSLQRTLRTYRIAGDARVIAHTLTLAKMRAASNFTLEALDWNSGNNSFYAQSFQKSLVQFQSDGSIQNINLSSGVVLGTPASGDSPSTVGASNSVGIVFNSRGLPVDSSFNPIVASEAFYFNNGTDYYAVSVAVNGRVQVWKNVDSTWVVQ
jgi:prepilin-type N-terminal cleavage/methylation domain-containing protein